MYYYIHAVIKLNETQSLYYIKIGFSPIKNLKDYEISEKSTMKKLEKKNISLNFEVLRPN